MAYSTVKSALGSLRTTENSTVETAEFWRVSSKSRVLIYDPTDAGLVEVIRARGYEVMVANAAFPLSEPVQSRISAADVVLLDLSTKSYDAVKTVGELVAAVGICNVRPRLLCFSMAYRNPQFVLAVEKTGARYIRVGDPAMLVEAIVLLLAEMSDFEQHGPCFQIVHRFSQGSCAPGEEVSAIFLHHRGNPFQLRLAVVERLLFDILARHSRIALDSSQIVSGLSNDWFYRDHASNSGHRQVKNVRRPMVKVYVQRIRGAIASTLSKAHLRFDPYDILRSCPAEGTNRILYRLSGTVRWVHERW